MGIPSIDGVPYHLQYPQAPAQAVVPPPQPQEEYHQVEAGDTLESIAQKYSTSVAAVRETNNLRGSVIKVGQRLTINAPRGGQAD